MADSELLHTSHPGPGILCAGGRTSTNTNAGTNTNSSASTNAGTNTGKEGDTEKRATIWWGAYHGSEHGPGTL